MATVELLERQGVEVMFPSEQTCCGQPAFNAGYRDESRELAQRFVDIFEPLVRSGQVDALVAPSGSCVAMTAHFYDVLFERDPAYRARAAILASVTFELTEFLVDVLGVTDVGAHFEGKLTYHASLPSATASWASTASRTCCWTTSPAPSRCRSPAPTSAAALAASFPSRTRRSARAMGRRKTQNLADNRRRRGRPLRRELHDPHQRPAHPPGPALPGGAHRPAAGQRGRRSRSPTGAQTAGADRKRPRGAGKTIDE